MKQYRRCCKMFPLQLPLVEEQDEQTCFFGGIVKNLQGGCTGEAETQQLDLGGELAAYYPSGNALLHRLPLSNRGASLTLPNQRISSQR
jgi:hypothetical protein